MMNRFTDPRLAAIYGAQEADAAARKAGAQADYDTAKAAMAGPFATRDEAVFAASRLHAAERLLTLLGGVR